MTKAKEMTPALLVFDEMEKRLLTAYLALVAKRGVSAVTFQRVADEAGVAVGTVRYNFERPGKLRLADAAAQYIVIEGQRLVESLMAKQQEKRPNDWPINVYITATFSWLSSHAEHTSFLLYFYYLNAIGDSEPLSASAMWETARIRIQALLRAGVEHRYYLKLNHVSELAAEIHSLLIGSCLVAGSPGPKSTLWKIEQGRCIKGANRLIKSYEQS